MHRLLLPVLVGTACALGCAPQTTGERFDLVVSRGRVVDGTGNPWFLADVAVRGDRIVLVAPAGSLDSLAVTERIDAQGRVVAPGFIDIQSHSWNESLFGDGRMISKVSQGVTSEILGEATTPAPANDNVLALYSLNDEDDAAMRKRAATFTGDHGFAAWLDSIDRHGNSVNVGSYLGATTVRAYAMGQRTGTPGPAELDSMRAVVQRAMRDGAFGISSALIYPPGAYAGTAELVEMAKAMAPLHGGYITHMRSEDDSLLQAMDEAFRIGTEGGVPVTIYHLKASLRRNWSKAGAMVAKIDSARLSGFDVTATMYPYPFSGNNLGECVPDWAAEGGKMLDNLRDATLRARLIREMTDPAGAPLCQHEGPTAYMIANFRKPEFAKYEGQLLSDIAKDLKRPWAEAVIDLLVAEGRDLAKINFTMSEDNVRMQLQRPWVAIGSDAGGVNPDSARGLVHPRAYGTYPKILGRYVREQGILTLEDAVRRMTSAVAARLGIKDRGLIREGMFADLTIFDPNTIADHATPAKPHQLSTGVTHTIVNGVVVWRNGRHTNAGPGRALRGAGWRAVAP